MTNLVFKNYKEIGGYFAAQNADLKEGCLGGKCFALSKTRLKATTLRFYSLTLMLKGKKSKAELRSKSFDPTNEVRQGTDYCL